MVLLPATAVALERGTAREQHSAGNRFDLALALQDLLHYPS